MSFVLSVYYKRVNDSVSVYLHCPVDGCPWSKEVAMEGTYQEIDSLDMEFFLQEHAAKDHRD